MNHNPTPSQSGSRVDSRKPQGVVHSDPRYLRLHGRHDEERHLAAVFGTSSRSCHEGRHRTSARHRVMGGDTRTTVFTYLPTYLPTDLKACFY